MASETFQCSVITPEAQVFDGPAEFVAIPAHDGEIGVMRDRAPLLCRLGAGRMRVQLEGKTKHWFIDSGFAHVLDNHVVVLTKRALRPEEMDRAKAHEALAEARRMEVTDEVSARRKSQAEASARAQLRMAAK